MSEVWLSKVIFKNNDFRIDSEPYRKNIIKETSMRYDLLKNIATTNPSKIAVQKQDFIVSFIPMAYLGAGVIAQKEDVNFSEYSKGYTYFAENDIIIAKITPCMEHGKCAIARNLTNGIGLGSTEYNVFRVKDENQVVTEYLFVYLNREEIRNRAKDNFVGTSGRQRVPISFYSDLKIPIPSLLFQQQVGNMVKSAHAKLEESKQLYAAAEDQLLSELGLKNWHPKNENINVKTLKESFLSSGRLDAEYYQSKYDEMYKHLAQYECDTINNIVKLKKSVEPGSDAYQDNGIPFVRVSDVNKFGISEPNIFLSPDDFDLQELRPKKDTILLSKDGSVGIAYKVEKDLDCITSGALLHLTVFNQDYNPDYLTLVLNSIIVKMQAERDANGAIIQHWKPSEIEQVIIPKLPKTIQDDISAKIQQSFALKAESKRLLEEAKMMVEKEIEKGDE